MLLKLSKCKFYLLFHIFLFICFALHKPFFHLCRYVKNNGAPPQRIVFYRDGVGEGQVEQVRTQEVDVIRELLGSLNVMKFTFLIITKRINTRFYKINPDRQIVNPPSGSIFDDVVTLPERYDFFVVSQSVRQGTANPTSYNVIEDNSGWNPTHLQQLTYKLSHLYYNWPGIVSLNLYENVVLFYEKSLRFFF